MKRREEARWRGEEVLSCPGPRWGSHVAARCCSQDGGFGSLDGTRWDSTDTHSLWLYKPTYPAGYREHKHTKNTHTAHMNTHVFSHSDPIATLASLRFR